MLKKALSILLFSLLAISGCSSDTLNNDYFVLSSLPPASTQEQASPVEPLNFKHQVQPKQKTSLESSNSDVSKSQEVVSLESSELAEDTTTVEEPPVTPLPTTEKVTDAKELSNPEDPSMVKPDNKEKNVYLTFDDGPDSINTPHILAILDEYGVQATFFVIGSYAERHPDIIRKIVQRGNQIANHTFTHKYESVYASEESFLEEIRRNEELLFEIIGKKPAFIREPGGKFLGKPHEQRFITDAGYIVKGWNVDSYDSRKPIPTAKQILSNVKKQAKNENLWEEMIILFHDGPGHASTVEALPALIEYLQAQGFTFKVFGSE